MSRRSSLASGDRFGGNFEIWKRSAGRALRDGDFDEALRLIEGYVEWVLNALNWMAAIVENVLLDLDPG
ncbi:MAG: hypothetical protein ACE5KH_04785 [Candidatus Geothermarchaeales archaeon]